MQLVIDNPQPEPDPEPEPEPEPDPAGLFGPHKLLEPIYCLANSFSGSSQCQERLSYHT